MEHENNRLEERLVAVENGGVVVKEVVRAGKTAQNMSTTPLRTKSDVSLTRGMVGFGMLRNVMVNLQQVLLGTKLCVLFLAVPLAIVSHLYGFARAWVFAFSLIGLTPLAERVSFLTEQIAHYTGPTVGGLVNATCGNVTELIIAILALSRGKIDVVKYSLLGSILSNLLLVLGSSLFFGGLANLTKEQTFDRKQADVNCLLLLLALFCHMMPLLFKKAFVADDVVSVSTLNLSRGSSIFMLIAYFAYLIFQLWTHRPLFEPTEVCGEDETDLDEEAPVVSFWSGFAWLVGMTAFIALLSEYVVGTIEDASESWGISVSFISIILLPIVGNAAEHAGAIIFALKNKLDISLGVALGSATQISMFAVPVCIIVSWIMGVKMDLDLSTIETGSLACSIIITSFALQDGSSHYMKGLILLLCYVVIGVCFICLQAPLRHAHMESISTNNQAIGF